MGRGGPAHYNTLEEGERLRQALWKLIKES
jgi:hypothetical protein